MTTITDHQPDTLARPEEPGRRGPSFGQLAQRYSLIALWVVMALVFFLLADVPLANFLQGIFARQTPLVFLGIGVVLTMAVGEFDLSFASIYALSGASTASLVVLHGWSFPWPRSQQCPWRCSSALRTRCSWFGPASTPSS